MTAYIIADITVTDAEAYDRYRQRVAATLVPFGGRFVVRGGRHETLEGDWQPGRLVILAFDSLEQARAWWDSPEYAEPKALRQAASVSRLVVVEGL